MHCERSQATDSSLFEDGCDLAINQRRLEVPSECLTADTLR
jgi:hypothetical protein